MANATSVIPVILGGGSRTCLRLLSRAGFPKEFLALSGSDSKNRLFKDPIQRINAVGVGQTMKLCPTLIVANEEHRFVIFDQLRELTNIKTTLLFELTGRNTTPALTLASLLL